MGNRGCSAPRESDVSKPAGPYSSPALPRGALASLYQERVARLAAAAATSPPGESLEATLRQCIAFSYGGGPEWAPHVRVTVFADNPTEHQHNVPVLSTILCTWGVPGFTDIRVACTPIPGTDVAKGQVVRSAFWSQSVPIQSMQRDERQVLYRDLMHQLLQWFTPLRDDDSRKQLLINMVLQLHEACFNCVGRHKEVFEYCVYDLIDAEAQGEAGVPMASLPQPTGPQSRSATAQSDATASRADVEGAVRAVRRHAALFLDRHKRNALHAAVLSPMKFLYQNLYEVFENLDSHGASFWVAVFTQVFFQGLQMPYESIVGLDTGWTWGAIDFLPQMSDGSGDAQLALARLSAEENLGRDWRSVTAGLRSLPQPQRTRLRGLPHAADERGFGGTLREAQKPCGALRRSLAPYAARFARLMATPVLLRCYLLQAVSSVSWDVSLAPALSALSAEALGEHVPPGELRERLCGSCIDASLIEVDVPSFAALLKAAGVAWAA